MFVLMSVKVLTQSNWQLSLVNIGIHSLKLCVDSITTHWPLFVNVPSCEFIVTRIN